MIGVAALLAFAHAGGVRAQALPYPTKPIRLIVPTPPGGGADIATRIIAKKLAEGLGQPVLVENRAGAGGNVSAEYVAKQPPDGYTIYMGAIGPFAISPSLYKSLPYDPLRDFAPITLSVVMSNILVAHPSVTAKTVAELVAIARAAPGRLSYGSSGNGSTPHLAGEIFKAMTGVDLLHVPYKGSGQSLADTVGGQVQVSFDSLPSQLAYIRGGKLRALAVTSLKRSAGLPEVPTVAESGFPGFDASSWFGLVGPAGLPAEIANKASGEVARILAVPAMREKFVQQGSDPVGSTPEEFGAYIRAETEKWARVVRATGARVD